MSVFVWEEGRVKLSRVEIVNIPEFKTVLRNDKGSPGDAEGKKKFLTFAIFSYIYLAYDYESPYANLGEDDRIKGALRDTKDLPEGWKPDKDVRAAIKKYVELQDIMSPSQKVLTSLMRGLNVANKVINALVDKINKLLDQAESDVNSDTPLDKVVPDITPLVTDLNTLLSLAKRIPEAMESIEIVREKVMKEKGGSPTIRGNRAKRNREDPSYIKEKYPEEENAPN